MPTPSSIARREIIFAYCLQRTQITYDCLNESNRRFYMNVRILGATDIYAFPKVIQICVKHSKISTRTALSQKN